MVLKELMISTPLTVEIRDKCSLTLVKLQKGAQLTNRLDSVLMTLVATLVVRKA